MALILNIETATQVCSVSLSKNGKIIALKETSEDKSHASKLTIYIDEILKENKKQVSDLDAIAVSKGPGSYTGLRIGVATAKGLAFSQDKPLIAINTLQAMAQEAAEKDDFLAQNKIDKKTAWFCPMIDARRMEVYSAFFDAENNFCRDVKADIIDENSYSEIFEKRQVIFFGNGADKCKEEITHSNAFFISDINTSAKNMAILSEKAFAEKQFEDVAYFEPFYLKDFIAIVSKKNILGK